MIFEISYYYVEKVTQLMINTLDMWTITEYINKQKTLTNLPTCISVLIHVSRQRNRLAQELKSFTYSKTLVHVF